MKRPAGAPIEHSYEGKVLIATPSLRDGVFTRAVVYMCAHRSDGAMGIVVNQRANEIRLSKLLVQLDIVKEAEAIRMPPQVDEIRVLRGGPVDTGRGFVLHSSDYVSTDFDGADRRRHLPDGDARHPARHRQRRGAATARCWRSAAPAGRGPTRKRNPRQRLARPAPPTRTCCSTTISTANTITRSASSARAPRICRRKRGTPDGHAPDPPWATSGIARAFERRRRPPGRRR